MRYFECDETGKVLFIHFMPFDTEYGIGKTEEDLLKTGLLRDDVPEEYPGEIPKGKEPILYFKNGEFSWILEDLSVPPTYEELLTMAQAIERGMTT